MPSASLPSLHFLSASMLLSFPRLACRRPPPPHSRLRIISLGLLHRSIPGNYMPSIYPSCMPLVPCHPPGFESLGTCARAFRPFSHEPDHATSRCAVSNSPSLSTAGLPDLNDWDRRYWDGPRLVTNPPATLVILLMVSGHLYTASANIGGGHHGNVWRFKFSFNMLAGVSDTGTSAVVPAPPIPSQAYRC